jgi:creatinine amidohydrolase
MPKGIKMAEVTWKEIELAFKKNWPVIIPLGAGCKEHGLHLPMNTDSIQAEYFANIIAEEENILVAPTIQDSYFPAFEKYAGSSSLSVETSSQYIVEKCRCWAKQGAKSFYILNMGISTNNPLKIAKEILAKENIKMGYLNLSTLYEDERIKNVMQQKIGTHADEIETSMMMCIKPEVVHLENAQPEEIPDKGDLTPDKNADPDKFTISPTGAWGNPTLATIEKGKIAIEVINEMIKKDIASFLNNIVKEDPIIKLGGRKEILLSAPVQISANTPNVKNIPQPDNHSTSLDFNS